MIPKYYLIQVNPDEIDIDKTPEMPPSTTNIDTQVAQAYFEEAEAMHIGRVTRSRSKFANMIVDEGLVGSSSSTIRRVCARVASTRRVNTRQTTIEACNAEYGNDDGDQEDEDIDNAIVDSSSDSDYVDNYDDTTTESSNDDLEEEI